MTHPLRSTGITPLHSYYEAVRPSPAHRYFQPRGWSRLCFSLGIAGQVLTFRPRARLSFAPSTCRMPLGQSQDIPQANPGRWVNPRFWHRLTDFDTSSTVHLRSPLSIVPAEILFRLFPQRSPPCLLDTAACGGLRSEPDCRPRRAYLHLSYSYAAPCGPALLVTQDPRVVPSFRCTFLPGMPSSLTPGSSIIVTCPVSRCRRGLRRELTGSTLPTLPQSDSRGRPISWLHWFTTATACQVACPPGRIRLGYCPSHRGLLLPGFRRVGRPSRRWI